MKVLAWTGLSLILLGGFPTISPDVRPDSQSAQTRALDSIAPERLIHRIGLLAEITPPMFHGTIEAIDRDALRVMIRTDFGRVVSIAIGSCEVIQWLQIGDHVRLDVDPQGIVRNLEKTTSYLTDDVNIPRPSTWLSSRCPEATT